MSNVKNAILQKKVEGIIYDIMARTNTDNVFLPDGSTLAVMLSKYLTATEITTKINDRISSIVDGAPEAFDTLKEISDYISQHEDVYTALSAAIGNKVDKEAGKGLSENDFTDALKIKLEGLQNYTHPDTHSAAMITETADRKFVTQDEKDKIAVSGRILSGAVAPADMTENDLFLQIVE